MRKFLILFAAFSTVSFALAGCASVPKPSSADDCLVLIKTEYKNSTTFPVMRKYRLLLSTGGKPIEVPSITSSYMAIVLSEPAVQILAVTSDVRDPSAYGQDSKSKADIALPYKPGAAVVADFCIVQEMVQGEDENSFMSGISLKKMEQFEKDELLQMLRDSGKIDGWSI